MDDSEQRLALSEGSSPGRTTCQREAELRASLSHSSFAIVRSELHHSSANNVARSEQINVLVDFIKFEELDAVTNLVLGGKRHDLTQVRVVAPIRAMKGLFAGYARE